MEFDFVGKEENVINNLAIKQELEPAQVLLQGLRLYQLLVEGLIEIRMTSETLKNFSGNF